jgi:hypothetical protein
LAELERQLADEVPLAAPPPLECSGLPQQPPAPRTISTSQFAARFGEQVLPVLGLLRPGDLPARSGHSFLIRLAGEERASQGERSVAVSRPPGGQ